MRRFRTRLLAIICALSAGLVPALVVDGSATALSNPTIPWLRLTRTIPSQPWAGSTVKAFDLEGSAYLPWDQTLWVVDDQADSAFEINPTTGKLLRTIPQTAFAAARPVGGGVAAGAARADAFLSMAYDVGSDTLYVFSGNCCGVAPFQPTAFRLKRDVAGKFQVESYQPLPEGTNAAAAGVRPGGGLYFGKGQKIRTYNYATNTIGANITITGAGTTIVGMTFTDANTLLVTTSANELVKVEAASWTAAPGWTLPLGKFGILNPTSVEAVGDQLFITDGDDARPPGDPLKYAVFVLALSEAPPVTASFTPHVTRGASPLNVWFVDRSVRADTRLWNFGDGTLSAEVSPAHMFTTPGDFTVSLSVTGVGGSSTASTVIHVLPATARTGGYTLDGYGALHGFQLGSTASAPTVSGVAYWPGWDIARGVAVLPDGAGGYTLDGYGGLHPFAIGSGSAPPAAKGAPYWQGWDAARGVALMPNGKGGYVVDLFGGIHRFRVGASALPPLPHGSPYWSGDDRARGITILANGSGGYVVDRDGNLHAFAIGSAGAPPSPTNVWSAQPGRSVQGVSMLGSGTGGYTIDGTGGVHGFAVLTSPPATSGTAIWPTWEIVRDVAILPGN
ncbi:MAG: PKD domain-containing protein [Acidimicrobiia bacterium]